MIRGEADLYKVKRDWHPDQMINLWNTFTGTYYGWCYVKDLNAKNEEADFAEPVDKYGQYTKPRLKF